jgi:hypothetical protein
MGRQLGEIRYALRLVEVSGPALADVDLLKRHHVRRKTPDDPCNAIRLTPTI